MRLATLALVLALAGCGSSPIKFSDPPVVQQTVRNTFRVSPTNKYLVVIKGRNSTLEKSCVFDDMDRLSVEIPDSYIETDIRETTKLAISKGYDVYSESSDSSLEALLDKIMKISNDSTKLMLAMSGECDNKGFSINLVHTPPGAMTPPDKKLLAEKIIAHLGLIKGIKAVIVHGCQSGCFADAARKDPDFKGVVIAACPVGYATTECQRTGTSAVYAGFLGLYRDDPAAIKNLSTADISAGFWFENFRHKVADIGAGGLPISYSPVIYSTAEFSF